MLRRIQWSGKGLKIKHKVGVTNESRSQRRKEELGSTAQHKNRDTSSFETEERKSGQACSTTTSCDGVS